MAVLGPTPVEDAIPLVEGHLELARRRGYRQWEAECNERLAVLWAMRRQFVKARAMLADGRAIRENLGVPGALVSMGAVETLAGDFAAAERAYRPALRLFEEQGNAGFVASLAADLAYILQSDGRDEEALQLTKESENHASTDDVDAQVSWRGARARVLADRGALDEAERLGREAVQLASGTDDLSKRATSCWRAAHAVNSRSSRASLPRCDSQPTDFAAGRASIAYQPKLCLSLAPPPPPNVS